MVKRANRLGEGGQIVGEWLEGGRKREREMKLHLTEQKKSGRNRKRSCRHRLWQWEVVAAGVGVGMGGVQGNALPSAQVQHPVHPEQSAELSTTGNNIEMHHCVSLISMSYLGLHGPSLQQPYVNKALQPIGLCSNHRFPPGQPLTTHCPTRLCPMNVQAGCPSSPLALCLISKTASG